MKEPLRGIRFRTVPEILHTVDRSIRTINTTGAAKGILRLPHRWQRVVHNHISDWCCCNPEHHRNFTAVWTLNFTRSLYLGLKISQKYSRDVAQSFLYLSEFPSYNSSQKVQKTPQNPADYLLKIRNKHIKSKHE